MKKYEDGREAHELKPAAAFSACQLARNFHALNLQV